MKKQNYDWCLGKRKIKALDPDGIKTVPVPNVFLKIKKQELKHDTNYFEM